MYDIDVAYELNICLYNQMVVQNNVNNKTCSKIEKC